MAERSAVFGLNMLSRDDSRGSPHATHWHRSPPPSRPSAAKQRRRSALRGGNKPLNYRTRAESIARARRKNHTPPLKSFSVTTRRHNNNHVRRLRRRRQCARTPKKRTGVARPRRDRDERPPPSTCRLPHREITAGRSVVWWCCCRAVVAAAMTVRPAQMRLFPPTPWCSRMSGS